MNSSWSAPGTVEPAHPSIIWHREDLVAIYRHIRAKYQTQIDKTFDQIAKQIGFVVTTTIPVIMETTKTGNIKAFELASENLQGSLFETETKKSLKKFLDDPLPIKKAGTYQLYFLWFEALKIKLRTDWMEPAHVGRTGGGPRIPTHWLEPAHWGPTKLPPIREVVWESHEPAHWFNPGVQLNVEEKILIDVIDEIYPELRLIEQIGTIRTRFRTVPDVVKEPVHYRTDPGKFMETPQEGLFTELSALLKKYGY